MQEQLQSVDEAMDQIVRMNEDRFQDLELDQVCKDIKATLAQLKQE